MLLDDNIVVAKQHLKTKIIFKNVCEKKTFNQTIGYGLCLRNYWKSRDP